MRPSRGTYSFSVLRYIHDAVSGEFVNVGTLLFSPDHRFLGVKCLTAFTRLSRFFGGIDGAHYRALIRHIEEAVEAQNESLFGGLPMRQIPESIEALTSEVLPADDSALQFSSKAGGGLTDDPRVALSRLFGRYVERYLERSEHQRRTDDQVLALFREQLRNKRALAQLKPKSIESPLYKHEFPLAWKNGIWNVCEPLSFDLVEGQSIVEKAAHWLGRATSLQGGPESFRLFFLIGKPSSSVLWEEFSRAERILRSVPVATELYREDLAGPFAERVAEDLLQHQQV